MESFAFAMASIRPADWPSWWWYPNIFIPSANISGAELDYHFGISQRPEAHSQPQCPQVELVKQRRRLQNATLPRPKMKTVAKSRWRLQNRPLQKPLNQIALMARTSTWDKAPLEDDLELEFLLEQVGKSVWESESTHASESDSDYQQSLSSDHQHPNKHVLDPISAVVQTDRPESPSSNVSEESWSEIFAWADASHPQLLELVETSLEASVDKEIIGASRPLPPWLQRRPRKAHRDESIARSRTESFKNASPRQASESKVVAISPRPDAGVDAKFLGAWGPASITLDSLTWNEGGIVRIDIFSETQFRMEYFDQQGAPESFVAELRSNGTLRWSDGDVWSRPKILSTCSQGGRKEHKDESMLLSETDLCHLDKTDDSDRTHNRADNESQLIVSSNAVESLPPWLKRRPRKSRREELVASTERDLGARYLTSAKVQVTSDRHSKKADGESHQSESVTRVVRSNTLVDMAVVTLPTQWDAQRNRDVNKSANYTDLKSASVCAASTRAHASTPACHTVSLAGPFHGAVKWFRGSYGWVDSMEAKKTYRGCDVFLHVSDCDFKPRQGDEVEFFVDLDDRGNPKAIRATQKRSETISRSSIGMINGRDYFAARDAKLEMRKRK